jgi:predicted amidohydrolase YtcJ
MNTRSRLWVLLALLPVAIGCVVTHSQTADVVFHGGRVVTMVDEGEACEAIVVAGNRITYLGDSVTALSLAGPQTRLIDLEDRVVYPGFIDPHTHLLNDSYGQGMTPISTQDLALRNGITTAANMFTPPESLREYVDLADQGEMRVRFSVYLIHNTSCGEILGDWYAAYEPLAEIAPRLTIGGVKIFSETSVCGDQPIGVSFATLVSRLTPAGVQRYGANRPLFTTSELTDVIRRADDLGFPVAIHAIGEGGIEASLDAIDAVLGGGPNTLRHTILHNTILRDDLLPRYEASGVLAAIEPTSSCFADYYREALPPSLKHIVRRWGDLVGTGARVTANSDWPWCAEESISPLFRLQALMVPENRSASYAMFEPCGLLPEDQLLSAWQGLQMMTRNAAYMLHCEDERGTLEVGKLADLVVLSADPLLTGAEELTDVDVLLTMVDGVIEWENPSF